MKRWLLCIPVLVLSALVLSASGAIAQARLLQSQTEPPKTSWTASFR